MKIKKLGLILLCMAAPSAYSANVIIKPLVFNGSIPYVESADANIASAINKKIYEEFELTPPEKYSPDIKLDNGSDGLHGHADISYEVSRNDEKILSIQISSEYTGAYTENGTSHHNFDLSNGKPINIEDLLTPEGVTEMNKRLYALEAARMKKEIAALNRKIKRSSATASAEDIEFMESSAFLYEGCIEANKPKTEPDALIRVAYSGMKITKTHITFNSDRCSNHAMRALDSIGNFENTFSFKSIKPFLSAYAKNILFSQPKSK
jgi:hypothetical protein